MSNIDQEIRKALMEGQSDEIQELGHEQNIWEMSMELFRGQQKMLTIGGYVIGIFFLVVGVWALLKFLTATEMLDIARFGMLFMAAFASVMAMKIWFWMVMNRNAVIREILRLELRIQEISQKLDRN